MNYSLATPPTSPIRQNNGEKIWPSTYRDNFITGVITQSGTITKEVKSAPDTSLLTPPVSPTKEKINSQERQIEIDYQEHVPRTNDESSGTVEDIQLLYQGNSIEQLDGADVRAEQNFSSEPCYLSQRETPKAKGNTVPKDTLNLCSDDDSITQERENSSVQTFSSKTQNSRPLTSLPLSRRPMLTTPIQGRRCLTHLQRSYTSPDRFVAQRSPPDDDMVTSFKVGKSTEKLSDAEKITRSQSASPDPFSTHIPHIEPLSQTHVRAPTSNLVHDRRVSPNSIGMLGLHQFNDVPQRQVSSGTVWCVGGPGAVTDSRIGVSDGRGGLLRRGTNAPLYGNLFTSRADAASVLNTHERRIALAANLDQSRRVIAVNNSLGDSAQIVATSQFPVAEKTVWRNNEWAVEGSIKRMFSSC